MPLKLDGANVVVVGKFNPYIFSPEWLEEQRIWSNPSIRLALGAVSEGVHFHAADNSAAWQVDPNALTIVARDAARLAELVLDRLPHTPLMAVGCNFSFSSEKWDSDLVPKLGELKIGNFPCKYNPELTSWTGIFHIESIRIQMMVAQGLEGITVTFNHQESVTEAKSAINALKKFECNLKQSEDMIFEILKETTNAIEN